MSLFENICGQSVENFFTEKFNRIIKPYSDISDNPMTTDIYEIILRLHKTCRLEKDHDFFY